MTSMILSTTLTQKITHNANFALQFYSTSLSKKIQSAANRAFTYLKDFFICLKQTFGSALIFSPLYLKVGFSFHAISLKHNIIISVTLLAITNIFLATYKFLQMPKHKDSYSEQQVYNFLKDIIKEEEINEFKEVFSEEINKLFYDKTIQPELKAEELSNLSIHFKELVYQTARNHTLRVLNKESKDSFDRFWDENFKEFCQITTEEMISNFHVSTNWEFTLVKHLDSRIVKQTLLAPLLEETNLPSIPSSVTFTTVYDWFEQINWRDKNSPHYLGKQDDPDYPGQALSQNALKSRIKDALSIIEKREARISTPKPNTKEFNIFYDNLENKLKACIWHLQKEEQRLKEKIDGQSYENLDEETKREYIFLCENKGRLCCQIAIAGSHCPVRLTGEISQEYNKLLSSVSSSDEEVLSLEQLLIKLLGSLRLEIANEQMANERISRINQLHGVHAYAAYMHSIGKQFNVPGSKDTVEKIIELSKEDIANLALDFSNKYTPNTLIKTTQSFYKKSYNFREKVQTWIQDRAEGWKKEDYSTLFLTIQNQTTEKLRELENLSVNSHAATDLYLSILNTIDPTTKVNIGETSETASLIELSQRLQNNDISFEDFQGYLFSLNETNEKIKNSSFYADQKIRHVRLAINDLTTKLNDLDCNEDLAQLAISILQKKEDLKQDALKNLSRKLTTKSKISALAKITNEHSLTGIDFKNYKDEEKFAQSLRNAILVKQKCDYLEECLGEDTSDNILPEETAEELLVSYNVLERNPKAPVQKNLD